MTNKLCLKFYYLEPALKTFVWWHMFMSNWTTLITPPTGHPRTANVHFRDSYPIDVSDLSFYFSLTVAALDMYYLYGLVRYLLSWALTSACISSLDCRRGGGAARARLAEAAAAEVGKLGRDFSVFFGLRPLLTRHQHRINTRNPAPL